MGEIEQLRTDITDLDGTIKDKDKEIAKLRRETSRLQQDRDSLTSQTNNLCNDKEALEESNEAQKTAHRLKVEALNAETTALRKQNAALIKKLDSTPATTKHVVVTKFCPGSASLWQNLCQLPWWMKAIFLLMIPLYGFLFLGAYQERKKWLDANDLSWEVTPYDLGRGYSYGTGYSYDYGGGYSSNSFVRWIADDVFKLTRTPYD